jgi:hypothetical protein
VETGGKRCYQKFVKNLDVYSSFDELRAGFLGC